MSCCIVQLIVYECQQGPAPCRPTPAISIPDAGSDAALQSAMRFRHSLLASHADAPLRQLSRLTLCTGDPTTAATALACSTAQAYDILAVQPATERVLLQVNLPACSCVWALIMAQLRAACRPPHH